jgi:hypothetical protein
MARIEKTVFLSYRRTAVSWALAIYQNLTHHGYDVFIDYEGIASGDFSGAILENIKARAHFILLLTPSALERCDDPRDWLRREIETAIDTKRNIVPLLLEGVDFGTLAIGKQLEGSLAPLKSYNALNVPAEYFEAAMDRLRNRHLNVALDAVLHPPSHLANEVAREQQNAADAARVVEQQELAAEEWLDRRPKVHADLPPIARPSATWGPRAEVEVVRWLSREGSVSADADNGYFRLHRPDGGEAFVEIRLVGPDPHLATKKVRPSVDGALDRKAVPFILVLVAATSKIGWQALPVLGRYLRTSANLPRQVQVVLSHLDSSGLQLIERFEGQGQNESERNSVR